LSDAPERQFGTPREGLRYKPRQCAYGLVCSDGKIAVARIKKGPLGHDYDLPGGALDGDESEAEAMVREVREETGLEVRAGMKLGVAGQYWRKRSLGPTNNICHFYRAEWTGEAGRPEEPDHELVWMTPGEAEKKMRHGAHAWAIHNWALAGKDV